MSKSSFASLNSTQSAAYMSDFCAGPDGSRRHYDRLELEKELM